VQALRQNFQRHVRNRLQRVAKHLKFIDESGTHLGLTRLFGRAAPGERVCEATLGYSGKHYTVIAALGLHELSAPAVLEGAMTTAAFETYVEHVLAPTLRPGDIVVTDNLNVHRSPTTQRLITARGARLEFLPPYSPDLNPIEKCWAKVKTVLRKLKARTYDELVDALWRAFGSITPQDMHAWFAHCGYLAP
jgi:transposase